MPVGEIITVATKGQELWNSVKGLFGSRGPTFWARQRASCSDFQAGRRDNCIAAFLGLVQLRLGEGTLTRTKSNWLHEAVKTEITVRGHIENLSNYWDALDLLDSRGRPVLSINQARERFGVGTITGLDSSERQEAIRDDPTKPKVETGQGLKIAAVGLGLLTLLRK